jgi:hypothetical protein
LNATAERPRYTAGMAIWLYFCAVVPLVAVYLMARGENFFVGCIIAITPMWCAVPLAALHATIFQRWWRPTWFRSVILGVLFGVASALITLLAVANLHIRHPEESLTVASLLQPALIGGIGGVIFGLLSYSVALKRRLGTGAEAQPTAA